MKAEQKGSVGEGTRPFRSSFCVGIKRGRQYIHLVGIMFPMAKKSLVHDPCPVITLKMR